MNKADNSSQQAPATAEQSTQKEIQGNEGKAPSRGRGRGRGKGNGGKGPNGEKGRGKGNNGEKGRGKGNNGGKGRRGAVENVNNRTNNAGTSIPHRVEND